MNIKRVPDTFAYAQKLFEYGFKNISLKKIIKENQIMKTISVTINDHQESLDVLASADLIIPLPKSIETHQIDFIEHISLSETETISKGDVVGFIEAKKDENSLGTIHLLASRDIYRDTPAKQSTDNNPILPILLITFLFFGVILFIILKLLCKKFKP
jgi:D-alanyl-D-alanine carboxypeptidase/D-alanyl-D-alanine carboxypeptidase (penicillin-binding protein 5/6)